MGMISALLLTGCSDIETRNQNQNSSGSTTQNSEMKKVKIGVILPLTGDAAAFGEEIKRVLDYQIPFVNEAAKAKGYEFDFIFEDGKCSGIDAVTAFEKLTAVDGVRFILGGTCSSETLGFAPLLEQKNVFALTPWSSSPEVEGKSPNLFSLSYSDDGVAKALADELGKYTRVALINEQNDYNQAFKSNVTKVLAEKYPKTEVVFNEDFAKSNLNFRNQLTKMKEANPEVVFLNPNVGATAEAMVKQLAEMKDWKFAKVGAFTLMGENILKISPETLEGTVLFDAPKINSPEFTAVMNRIVSERGSLDNLGSYYTAATLDAMNILTQVIMENESDSEKIKQKFRNVEFLGNLGTLRFKGKTFVELIEVARFEIRDGKIVPKN